MKMKPNRSHQSRWLLAVLGVLLAATATAATFSTRVVVPESAQPVHLTTDWSHRNMVFSAPKTLRQALELSLNPRYRQQLYRRNFNRRISYQLPPHRDATLKGDWSTWLGANATQGAGMYPAKFDFDINNANCANDFVVYGTSTTGSATPVYAEDQLLATGIVTAGTYFTITDPHLAQTLTLTSAGAAAHTGVGTGTFAQDIDPTNQAADIAAAINIAGNGNYVEITATSNGPILIMTVTYAPGTVGDGWEIGVGTAIDSGNGLSATYSGASYFANGANATASLVGINNLYSGCPVDPTPNPMFAYNTGGNIHTSVVLSNDGSQIAFVQTIAGVANLSVLKWATGPGGGLGATGTNMGAPVNVTPVAAAAFRACVPTEAVPCQVNIPFGNGDDDANSSPYYDYVPGADLIYVGDNGGNLHKFTGIFAGTPAEVTTAPWPVYLGTGLPTTGPVFDAISGNIFIADGDYVATDDGGYLHAVTATTGAVATSEFLALGAGIVDSPIVDSTTGTVYVAYADDSTGTFTVINQFCTTAACTDGLDPIGGNPGTPIHLGAENPGSANYLQYASYLGDFDNAFYSGGAGHMYACGNDAVNGTNPTLYQIPVSAAGVLGAPTAGPALTTNASAFAPVICSPVTEVYNPNATGGAKDWVFLSVQNLGVTGGVIGCPVNLVGVQDGCIMSFDVTSGAGITGTTPTAASAEVPGGTSGIIIDNVVSPAGALAGTSQVYYTPLSANGVGSVCPAYIPGFGGCAIQASQAALR